MDNNSLKGIGLFQLSVIHLISIGKKESIKEIEEHFASSDLIDYLYLKYQSDFLDKFDNSCYNNVSLNAYFEQFHGYIESNEQRKYGIMNNDDGLLLILALISDEVEYNCYSWKIKD